MNPFVHYRHRLESHRRALDTGLSDSWFVDAVERLDAAVVAVDGRGFMETPLRHFDDLVGGQRLWVKDETGNVGGSHKARHLFGLALHLAVDEAAGDTGAGGALAIASCGNAAIGAAIIAKAMHRKLNVFIPSWADEQVVARLRALDAGITRCERREGEEGDPAYLRFREAVGDGATAFSVQSPDAPATLDGGRTLGWELAAQLADRSAAPERIYIQVGGGALAAACMQGMRDGTPTRPALFAVQSDAAAPLARAWQRLVDEGPIETAVHRAAAAPGRYMMPWSPIGNTTATGILDDVTYDWLGVLTAMIETGGAPLVVAEACIVEACERARAGTGIDVSATGSAGLAGLLAHEDGSSTESVVLFTGARESGTKT